MPGKDPFSDRVGTPTPASGPSDAPGGIRDLCSNCDHSEEHARHGRPKRPILFCEEFEVPGAMQAPELNLARPQPPKETQNDSARIGLCVNCEFVDTCTLPSPEGGVWHCEEYR
jgi:hypothetical protein